MSFIHKTQDCFIEPVGADSNQQQKTSERMK